LKEKALCCIRQRLAQQMITGSERRLPREKERGSEL